ncbi:hypothetical protein [Acuticoccus sp. I52.16.1]|uniref:hypothetical protein n=1 Tax=Acuticoccus sp. I52.16.1 TaxID=2928472 RepID=UPI001FD04462|nr:hypothetical protein [Acuticoccus sp. I52.16.1]UOM33790.1 hypothetical protein MRB58_18430 [Acuticoccus sp. I52.16.1]
MTRTRAVALALAAALALAWAAVDAAVDAAAVAAHTEFASRAGLLLAVSLVLTVRFDAHLVWLAYLLESLASLFWLFVLEGLRVAGGPVALVLACLYVATTQDLVPDTAGGLSRVDDMVVALVLVIGAHRAALAVPRLPSPFAEPGGLARIAAALVPAYVLLWSLGVAPV